MIYSAISITPNLLAFQKATFELLLLVKSFFKVITIYLILLKKCLFFLKVLKALMRRAKKTHHNVWKEISFQPLVTREAGKTNDAV